MKFLLLAAFLLGSLASAAPPATVHPNWSLLSIRPAGLQTMVTGIDFLSDGRMVITHWGGTHEGIANRQYGGKVYIVSGVTGNTPSPVAQVFADSLEDPLGLKVVNDTIYVCGGNRILRLLDTNGDGKADARQTVFTLKGKPLSGDSLVPVHARHEFLYGLLYKDGFFYAAPGVAKLTDGSNPDDDQVSPNRGTLLKVNAKTGAYEVVAMGFRQPNGLGWGPNGEIFSADVQGNWLPASKLIHIQPGRFYGFKHTPAEKWDTIPETPPAVLLPQTAMGNAAGVPLYVPTGLYAGQYLMGDVYYGGIQRYFLEKIDGQYQGAAFNFMGGLESGIHALAWGPDGMLYAGGVGGSGNWGWSGKTYGLQKLRYNGGDTAFEMLAVRSRPAGMEIEFTRPVDSATAALPASYTVTSMYFIPIKSYGCVTSPSVNCGTSSLTVQSVRVSPDRRKVYLALPGLQARTTAQPQRSIRIQLVNVKSSGAAPRTTETYYTLNALGTGNPFDPVPLDARADEALKNGFACRAQGRQLVVRTSFHGAYTLKVRDLRGALLARASGTGSETRVLEMGSGARFALVEAAGDGRTLRRALVLPGNP